MPLTAAQLINDVTSDLHDVGNVRWLRPSLLAWLNDGQREVVIYRPDASVSVQDMPLAAGWAQQIPAGAIRLMDVKANTSGRAVTLTTREALDQQRPTWRADPPAEVIRSWVYDFRTPKHFEVWPPATATASLKVALSLPPVDCANEQATIGLDDQYAGPIKNYMKHRAFARDSEDAANQALATMYYGLMVQALTGRTDSELAARPEKAAMQRKDPSQ